MHKTNLALLAAATVFAAAGMNGCYTMLVHPGVRTTDNITGAEKTAEVTHAERCTDCHTGDVHGDRSMMRGHRSGVYEGYNDYDPFWGYGGYYDPFLSSGVSSSYFFDNYYSYRNLPWWVYPPAPDEGGNQSAGQQDAPAAKEKPARRGSLSSGDSRGYSPMPTATRGSGAGAEKPSSTTSSGGSGDDDNGKEKPARRGGIR
jgi:hypothetical protein